MTDLIPADENTDVAAGLDMGGAVQKFSKETFDEIAGSQFMPRLQLMTSNSEKCKSGDFTTNHYALVKGSEHLDLGGEVDVLIIVWRPKAMRMGDQVLVYFDTEHPEFKRIEGDSTKPNSGCMYGPEFLVWIPEAKEFATFFMGSISARNESGSVLTNLGQAMTIAAQKIVNPRYTWFAPQAKKCSNPIQLPAQADFDAAVEKFNNPVQSDIETVDEAVGDDGGRAR